MVARAIGVIFVKFLTVTLTVTFFCLIFFIKCCFIPIGTKEQSFNPCRCSSHLFTDSSKVSIHRCFNDQFIMYMTYDKAVGESTHGMAEDIPLIACTIFSTNFGPYDSMRSHFLLVPTPSYVTDSPPNLFSPIFGFT